MSWRLALHLKIAHHSCIFMFHVMTVVDVKAVKALEFHRHLNRFTGHDQNRVVPATVYKALL